MAKTEEELSKLRERLEDLQKELDSLSDEELEKVTGGIGIQMAKPDKDYTPLYEP